MRRLWGCVLAGLLMLAALLSAGALQADGLIYRLPEDGTSVRYALDIKAGRDGMEKSVGGYLAISSVGKETVNSEPCRWLEFKMVFDIDGREETILAKVLIPEKALKSGANPGAQMVRGWVKRRQDAEEIKDVRHAQAGPLAAFLAGPAADAKTLAKAAVETKLGKLECEGVVGSHAFDQGNEKVEIKQESRLHDKSPFGVVHARLEFKVERDGAARESGTLTISILEVTQGAASELPENK